MMRLDSTTSDIFSAANLLFVIFMGEEPWKHDLSNDIHKNVMKGKKPVIDKNISGGMKCRCGFGKDCHESV